MLFAAMRHSWVNECLTLSGLPFDAGSQFEVPTIARHYQLLDRRQSDVEKFFFSARNKLAKYESEYSWQVQARLDEEIQTLSAGLLAGSAAQNHSIGFLARCYDECQDVYSRTFLKSELERRYNDRRLAPPPEFQMTLDYVRRLEGVEFEHWLEKLLRDNGVSSVQRTKASRDQGADLIVQIGMRRIVIQAKQYADTVGNNAVQEAHAARAYYNAVEAWVVTTSTFSKDAMDLDR